MGDWDARIGNMAKADRKQCKEFTNLRKDEIAAYNKTQIWKYFMKFN